MERPLTTAFVLMAGRGSRLRPHTDFCPKPLLPFLTLPLFYYSLYLLQNISCSKFVFNLHHLPERVRRGVRNWNRKGLEVHFSNELEELLGSGGALFQAQNFLKKEDFFIVANSDEVIVVKDDQILNGLVRQFHKDESLCTLLVCDHPDIENLKPVWISKEGRVLGFGKKRPNSKAIPKHYVGYKVFSSRIFDFLPQGPSHIFYDVLFPALDRGEKVTVYPMKGQWYETGDFPSFVKSSKEILSNHFSYVEKIFSFFKYPKMEVLKNRKNFLLKPKGLKLPSSFSYSGLVCLGPYTEIGKSVSLRNCFTQTHAHFPDQFRLEDQFYNSFKKGE